MRVMRWERTRTSAVGKAMAGQVELEVALRAAKYVVGRGSLSEG